MSEGLIVDCVGTADWRRRVAEQYPEDGRNLEAAGLLERLDGEIRALTGGLEYRRLERLLDQEDRFRFSEVVSEELKAVGFHSWPESGVDLLKRIARRLEGH
jgi:hypothetical protein